MSSETMGNEAFAPRTALITGASSGIGRAVATIMAAHGWSVLLAARRDDRLAACVAELRQQYAAEVKARTTDITQEQEVSALVASAMERWGYLDVVVNAAGHGRGWGHIGPTPAELWRNLLETNLLGSMLVIAFR